MCNSAAEGEFGGSGGSGCVTTLGAGATLFQSGGGEIETNS